MQSKPKPNNLVTDPTIDPDLLAHPREVTARRLPGVLVTRCVSGTNCEPAELEKVIVA